MADPSFATILIQKKIEQRKKKIAKLKERASSPQAFIEGIGSSTKKGPTISETGANPSFASQLSGKNIAGQLGGAEGVNSVASSGAPRKRFSSIRQRQR